MKKKIKKSYYNTAVPAAYRTAAIRYTTAVPDTWIYTALYRPGSGRRPRHTAHVQVTAYGANTANRGEVSLLRVRYSKSYIIVAIWPTEL